MEIDEIIRDKAEIHYGYQLSEIGKTSFDPCEIGMKPMKTIPHKLTSWLKREKIEDAYKCQLGRMQHESYYILRAPDGTLFHID